MTAIYEEPKKPRQIGSLNGAQAVIHGSATMKSTLILAIGCGLFASVAFAQAQPGRDRRTIGSGLREQGRDQ